MTTAAVAANPFAVPVGGQKQLNFTLTWNTGNQYDFTTSSNWSSNNTPVVTVQTGLTKGVSAGSATITAQATSAQPVYVAQICSQGTLVCPTGEPGGSSPGTVTPVISQDQILWYFNGNPAPSGFKMGSTTVTLTASGGGSGTYGWSITSGTSIATLKGTTSGSDVTSVQISSTSYSTTENDVTVQLQFEPTSGTKSVQTSYSLTVDSPYKLVSTGSTTNSGVAGPCTLAPAPKGTAGFQSLVPYAIISFQGQQIANITTAETLNNDVIFFTGEKWLFKPYPASRLTERFWTTSALSAA